MIKIIIKSSLLLLLLSIFLKAQEQGTIDTILSSNETEFEMQKSSLGAVGRSALLPGWGQFYNEDYWHIPVIWGFLGWFGYQWVQNNKDYKTSKELYIETGNEFYRRERDFYRDQRDNFTIYITITYLLNLVDAFVGAHLFDFSVEEDYVTKTPVFKVIYNF